MRSLLALLVWALALPAAALLALLALLGDALAAALARLRPSRRVDASEQRDIQSASVIIVNWNGRALLAQGLPSVVAAVEQAGGGHEIIVVDNGSTDGSQEYVRSAFAQVRLLEMGRNLGFGAGNNAGVQAARNDIVVLLNNDMVVDAGFLRPLLDPFAAPRVFAVSSQVYLADLERRREESGHTRGRLQDGRLELWHAPVPEGGGPGPILWAGGGSSAFDRRRFLALGGFDSLYAPFYVEDVDLSYRAWQQGWTVLFAPQSIVHHRHRASSNRFGQDYVEQTTARNRRLFVWRNVRDAAWTVQSLLAIAADLGRAVEEGQGGAARSILAALRRLPAAWRGRWAGWPGRAVSDRTVFAVSCSRFRYKERFAPPPTAPRDGRYRILMVTPYLPWPPAHGGAVRMLNLLKQLSRCNDVDLISLIETDAERELAPELTPFCRRLRLITRRPPYGRYRPLRDRSWHIEEFDQDDLRQAIDEWLGDEDYHILQIEYTQMAQYHPGTRRTRTVLDEIDINFRAFQRRTLAGRGRLRGMVDYLKLVRYEVESCRRFDRILTMSDDDARFLAGYLPGRAQDIVVAANGVETAFYRPQRQQTQGNELLFVGSYRHTPNLDGLRYFLRDVFPLILAGAPAARLVVVGDGPFEHLAEAAAARSAVTFTGFVTDTRPYLARCAAFVAPILSGSGTRIKILEALAAGAPVVSTTIGCEGIAAEPGQDILIADTAEAFAAAALRLLHDADTAGRLSDHGRRLVEERYDWAAIAARLQGVYDGLWQGDGP